MDRSRDAEGGFARAEMLQLLVSEPAHGDGTGVVSYKDKRRWTVNCSSLCFFFFFSLCRASFRWHFQRRAKKGGGVQTASSGACRRMEERVCWSKHRNPSTKTSHDISRPKLNIMTKNLQRQFPVTFYYTMPARLNSTLNTTFMLILIEKLH